MNRRNFLKTVGVAGAAVVGSRTSAGERAAADARKVNGVLVDTTMCAGCRNCEIVCAEANALPEPDPDDAVLDTERKTGTDRWTVINRYDTEKGEFFVKRQCMHCVQPACAAACLTRAMKKMPEGPVIWRQSKCMGCRYCMLSCPFDIPKFEYDSAVPRIRKCRLCWDRLQDGQAPACVENCPAEALKFGPRDELLAEGWRRIHADPDAYHHHIYGEHEVGGTGWLYLAAVPFEQLGFRTDLGPVAYPRLTQDFLYAVPVVLALWPAFLLALSNSAKRNLETARARGGR